MSKFVKIVNDEMNVERIINVDCIEQVYNDNGKKQYLLFLQNNNSGININKETYDFLETYLDINGNLV